MWGSSATAAAASLAAILLAGAADAAAQPYAWVPLAEFRGFTTPPANVLRIVNLGTTHVQSIDLPGGIVLGQGALDPITGHYFLITNAGTGEFAPSPPRLLPALKPWAGDALFFSPDGLHAHVCTGFPPGRTCALVRRSDDQVLVTRTQVLGIEFDQAGGHVITSQETAANTIVIRYFAPASPTSAVWTRTYAASSGPRVAVAGSRVFVSRPDLPALESIDSMTGALVLSSGVDRLHSIVSAGGGRVFAISQNASVVSLTSYSADTLAPLAEVVLGGPIRPPRIGGISVSATGSEVIVGTAATLGSWGLSLRSAETLQLLPGGGFPGQGFQAPPVFTSDPLCRVSVTPDRAVLPATGGQAQFTVLPDAWCGLWTASFGGEGLRLLGPTERRGPAPIVYAVAQNLSAAFDLTHFVGVAGTVPQITVSRLTETPQAPRVTGIDVGAGSTTISWDPSLFGPIPSGFALEGGIENGPVTRLNASKTQRSLTIPTPPAGEYTVRVRAVNAVGDGPLSAPVRFSIGGLVAPDVPTGLTADVRNTVVHLEWSAPAAGAAPNRYVVEAAAPGGSFFTVGTTGAGRHEFTGVAPPGGYLVRVRAANDAGMGPPGVPVAIAPTACTGPPIGPGLIDVLVTGALVTVAWDAPSGGAEQFVVEVGSEPGRADIATFTTSGPALDFRAMAPVSSYFLRVSGINACGRGSASSAAVAFVLWEPGLP